VCRGWSYAPGAGTLASVRTLVALVLLGSLASGCAGQALTPANVAPEPAGFMAVSFTRTFDPGFWTEGEHAYRLVITCPARSVGPPPVSFFVSEHTERVDTAYLRTDGPGTSPFSPADLSSVHPDDTTVAIVTLAGMTESDAEDARNVCNGTIVYDGLDPEPLEPGRPFSP
jgi:hypothetical protein